ncbi:UDP-N-acetylglucosamine--N-acetylmuramyl-(pentapeptide) pyrophosphoryl-undecaprenol N-acetylglucosamine transferase [Candidatus Nomurabacteria bacterium]|nr:UDP-N-acetylglucosamine--N-acetylmuramyl-(pentapeptide) pyrophosphoryl-undecaprenol N-acetylglucosamine transferase [Candidatus Nomurabacteria bacterium]
MKIVFTGGVTGGHFYPIISIVEEMRNITRENKLIDPEIYFLAPTPYNKGILFDNGIIYKKVFAGKIRRYASILNFFDLFKTAIGILKALWTVFWIYPDVIVGKGGYGSFPVLVAAKILHIPVIIHESDSKPGKVNAWAGKFAKKIAISYPEAAQYFPKNKQDVIALTGCPVRTEIQVPAKEGAHEFLGLEPDLPTILILGGSQGSMAINNAVLDTLEQLVSRYQIIHQTGKNNFKEVKDTADLMLDTSFYKNRYKPFDYMNDLAIRMSAGAADLVISRAGSSIFEIALWGKPSIIIPIPEDVSHDQRTNAFNYARSGAAEVIEENNLSPEILLNEIEIILTDSKYIQEMSDAAKEFAMPEAARLIAEEVLEMIISHE